MVRLKSIPIRPHLIAVFLFAIIVAIPSAYSLTIDETVQNFQRTVDLYDNDEISIAQMIVLLEHYNIENRRYLRENDLMGWTETDAETALRAYRTDWGHAIDAHDLHIFLGLYETTPGYYGIGHSVGGKKYPRDHLETQWELDIEAFKEEMARKYRNNIYDFSDLTQNWLDIAGPAFHVSYRECIDYMDRFMDEAETKNLPDYLSDISYYPEPTSDSRIFFTSIAEVTRSECLDECWLEADICEEICTHYRSEFGLMGHCSESEPYNFITLTRIGFINRRQLEYMQTAYSFFQSQPFTVECEPYDYDGRLYFRRKLQKSLDDDFFDWYVDDFLGEDIDKYIDPGAGIKRIMGFFEGTARTVSNILSCKGETSWPEQFEIIEIEYESENAEFHIWEEIQSTREFDVNMWSTYYRYDIFPSRDIMKELIERQLSEQSSFRPSPGEVEKIRSEKEVIYLIDEVTSGFGDSMDFKVILRDSDEVITSKYISINERVILEIGEKELENLDFIASIEFDDLYSFRRRLSNIDSQRIKGPAWSNKRSPMMVGERIGLIFDFWNTFSIEPRMAKVRLTTKLRTIVSYLQEINEAPPGERELIEQMDEQMATRDRQIAEIDETEDFERVQVTDPSDSDSIIFKLEITHPGGTMTSEYMAINLDRDYPDFRLTGDDYVSIILGSQQTGWHFSYGEWMEMTRMQSWDNLWESYYGQFEFAYSTILREKRDEIVLNPEPGVTMRIYDIEKGVEISPSKFNPK